MIKIFGQFKQMRYFCRREVIILIVLIKLLTNDVC